VYRSTLSCTFYYILLTDSDSLKASRGQLFLTFYIYTSTFMIFHSITCFLSYMWQSWSIIRGMYMSLMIIISSFSSCVRCYHRKSVGLCSAL